MEIVDGDEDVGRFTANWFTSNHRCRFDFPRLLILRTDHVTRASMPPVTASNDDRGMNLTALETA